jgi:tRNA threonylcarbamoyladenosine biosynthesis protein TsaE
VSISTFTSESESATRAYAAEFARTLHGDEKLCLIGQLGSGKTTFVRGVVEGFGISARDVASPTFTLIREYGKEKKIYHVDLYRLEREEDIFEAGIFELLSGDDLVLIEWADQLHKYRPDPCMTIEFAHGEKGERIIMIK